MGRAGVGWLAIALVVVLPFVWFAQLSSDGPFTCTPGPTMVRPIDARISDPLVHVVRAQVVESHDHRYENLFLISAEVRAGGAFVGIGTWASNVSGLGSTGRPFGGWSHVERYVSLEPVNELARTLTARVGAGRSPGMTAAAKFSQRCVRSANAE